MSLSAAVIRELVAAGLSGEGLVAACERIEAACPPECPVEFPVDKAAEKRRAYDRERKRVHRNSGGIPPESTGIPKAALSKEDSKKEKKKESRAIRIPPEWKPDSEFARLQGLSAREVDTEAEKFRNYWTAKSGKDACKLDWPATWRNWIFRVCEQRGIAPIVATENATDAARGWRPGLPTSAELEAKYASATEGVRLVDGAPMAQGGVRVRRQDEGLVRGDAGLEAACGVGDLLSEAGIHAGDVSRSNGRAEMDGAVRVARVDGKPG